MNKDGILTSATDDQIPFVVPDPITVIHDALHYTSWTDSGGSLPQRGDWSTFRLASKDLLLGIATHRFNSTTRQLDIRAYLTGEHPIFKELEPSRGMMAVLLCQSYQTGNSLELNFEQGVPFDVRTLIEQHIGRVISGHETLLTEEVSLPLFVSICGLSENLQSRIKDGGVSIASICYNIFRGTWSALQVNSLLTRGIPLEWLFRRSPNPIEHAAPYTYLMQNLRAVLLEEYALKRLEDRQFGESISRRLLKVDDSDNNYRSCDAIEASGEDISVQIAAGDEFSILSVLTATPNTCLYSVAERLIGLSEFSARNVLVALPMDFAYVSDDQRLAALQLIESHGYGWLVVGQTMAQLFSEAEQKLAITSAQADDDEVDIRNVDRHTD